MALYSNYRSQIKSGDFIAYTSKYKSGWTSIWGFLVSLFTLSRYSHVGIALWLGDRLFLVSADIPEVKLELLSKTKPFYHVPMDLEWNEARTEDLLEHLGERYSILEAIKGFFHANDDKNDQWFCTEFSKTFYTSLGLKFSDEMTPSAMVEDILEIESKSLTYVDTRG